MLSGSPDLTLHGKPRRINLYRGAGLGYLHPHAILDDRGIILLYYTPYPPDEAELPYLAVSRDGIAFHSSSTPLFTRGPPGSWDSHHIADVDVISCGDKWCMYYAGAVYHGKRKRVSIGLAVSKDGVHWEKYRGNPIMEPDAAYSYEKGTDTIEAVACPTVFRVNGTFYMYYEAVGGDGVPRIALASSSDGIHFQRRGVVLEPAYWWEKGGVNHPHASIVGDKVFLLYVAHDGCTRHLGWAVAPVGDPAQLSRAKKPLMSPPFPTGENCLQKRKIYRLVNVALRGALKRFLDWFPYAPPVPFWRHGSMYRSSLLTTPDRRVVAAKGEVPLYFSAYSLFSRTPSIGLAKISIEEAEQVGQAGQ